MPTPEFSATENRRFLFTHGRLLKHSASKMEGRTKLHFSGVCGHASYILQLEEQRSW